MTKSHGMSASVEYNAWRQMRARCNNLNCPEYKNYGARGIKVCKAWNHKGGFNAFFMHVGLRPPGHSLDRHKNSKGYYPSNVSWVTHKTNAQNTRRCRYVTYAGRTQCVSKWAQEYHINTRTLHGRLDAGLSMCDALATSKRPHPGTRSVRVGQTVYPSTNAAARSLRCSVAGVKYRICKGMYSYE